MRKRMIGISAAIAAAMIAAGLVTLRAGPPHAALPIHWNAAGVADGFARPWLALSAMPLTTLLVALLLAAVARIEPRQEAFAKSQGSYGAVWAGVLLLLGAAELAVLGAAWDRPIAAPRMIVAVLGLSFVLLGNWLGKSRTMYMVGIRTPWTLANEDVWIATHRLGGKLMVAVGVACLLLAAIGGTPARMLPIVLALLLASALVPVVYSYLLWRRLERVKGIEPSS